MASEEQETLSDDEITTQVPIEEHLDHLRKFVKEYSVQLRDIEEALDEASSVFWEPLRDPVTLSVQPYETIAVLDIVKTDNKIFNKVVTVLGALCAEIADLELIAQNKFYAPLSIFGESATGKAPKDGEVELSVSRILPLLCDLSNFVTRVNALMINLVHQLGALYDETSKLYRSTFNKIQLSRVFTAISDLMTILIKLDAVILGNHTLAEDWLLYKRMVKVMRTDPERYNMDEAAIKSLERKVLVLDMQLLSGSMFQNCCQQEFDVPGMVNITGNKVFQSVLDTAVRSQLQSVTNSLGDSTYAFQRHKLVGAAALFVFFVRLYPNALDRKLFKSVWELQKKVPIVQLYGKASWFLPEFLTTHVGMANINPKQLSPTDVVACQLDYLRNIDASMQREVNGYYLQTCHWMVNMESNLSVSVKEVLESRMKLLLQGVLLASQINTTFVTCISLHLQLEEPVKQSIIRPLCQCLELIKAIEFTYHRKSSVISGSLTHMIRFLSINIRRLVRPLKVRLEASKNLDHAQLDMLAALSQCLRCLHGIGSRDRRAVLAIAMNIAQIRSIVRDAAEGDQIRHLLWKLNMVCDFQIELRKWCNMSFLYWNRDFIHVFLRDVYERPSEARRLRYILAAFRDGGHLLRSSAHLENAYDLVAHYQDQLEESLKECITEPLCRDVETDLRVHIHAANVDARESAQQQPLQMKPLGSFLHLRPIKLFDRYVNLKERVEHYLDSTFYNLSTVALHDWRLYGEMRNLAKAKYDLVLTEVYLPGQTPRQGLDVLEIMRNIHIFVAKYSYNMNNQFFVERTGDGKHINSISIPHISNSIRTHGTGIMNTTVNFTYQFLIQKLHIFSEFLYDDHIKSRLIKDQRYFRTHKDELSQCFPFDRADTFNKDIRKLGVTDTGVSFLDQFRKLITEIGNALAYVRMVRTGGLHHCSNAIQFVPDLNNIVNFEELTGQESLASETVAAGKNLDSCINNLVEKYEGGTDYFKILIDVFADTLRGQEYTHLQYFFMIIPALTVNFVESMLVNRDRLNKKGKDASFTDDGFAIGVAYLLKLLNQNEGFNTLHWFDSVRHKYAMDEAEVQKKMAIAASEKSSLRRKAKAAPQDEEEIDTNQLQLNRIMTLRNEFEMFSWSFNGARIFFRE